MGYQLAGVVLILISGVGFAQAPDPSYASLQKAYEALRGKDYDSAVTMFRQAAASAPQRADIRKDLAYTLLKTGETEAARDQFAEVMRLNPADDNAALEYAFLCYETQEPATARRVLDRLRTAAREPVDREMAEQAFENIDRPLREGIARWQQALVQTSGNFSAHEELARLAENRDQLPLAAEHYQAAWRLRPERRGLLLDLGRVWTAQGRSEDAHAALLAASRGGEPRVAEEARELLPARYPYVYEFERAIALDPSNAALKRELEDLLVAMGNRPAPEAQPPGAKLMGERSLEKGYLKDALRYFQTAHETDPADFGVMLKLGWTYNILKNDREAIRWFSLARQSPDPATASEAAHAYRNLAGELERVRTTLWAFPTFSTRWHDMFTYAQIKTELLLGQVPVRPYLSVRFLGDVRGQAAFGGSLGPQYLSERSAIVGLGLATPAWRGLTGWFEAGEAIRYRITPGDAGRMVPDYRGGLSYARRAGRRLFAETDDDGVFVSRFGNDVLVYSQNRTGYAWKPVQIYWNWNATVDTQRQSWANYAETGPGVRLRLASMVFSVNTLHGAYLVGQDGARRANFNDIRIGVWYAITR